jgi:hypothetical protein
MTNTQTCDVRETFLAFFEKYATPAKGQFLLAFGR